MDLDELDGVLLAVRALRPVCHLYSSSGSSFAAVVLGGSGSLLTAAVVSLGLHLLALDRALGLALLVTGALGRAGALLFLAAVAIEESHC